MNPPRFRMQGFWRGRFHRHGVRANATLSPNLVARRTAEARAKNGGRYWTRTNDPLRVKQVL